jgi:hypothetical protein
MSLSSVERFKRDLRGGVCCVRVYAIVHAMFSMISFVEITLAYGTDNAAIKDA